MYAPDIATDMDAAANDAEMEDELEGQMFRTMHARAATIMAATAQVGPGSAAAAAA